MGRVGLSTRSAGRPPKISHLRSYIYGNGRKDLRPLKQTKPPPITMQRNTNVLLLLLLLLPLLLSTLGAHSLPLSTKGRWIVDAASGSRVKLRCANWLGHMPAVIPEGLNRKPVTQLAAQVAHLGFNCVRLTYSIFMLSQPRYRNLTVAESLSSLGLADAAAGVARNNPAVLDRTVLEAFDAVVAALGDAGVMVVLDNHVSKPMWCCGFDDGNGFFGDLYFDPEEWREGLETMARRFKGVPQVVGMSMRNELRGPNSTVGGWYEHMGRGASTIHAANPDVLVIVSGLNYDADLSFLRDRPFPLQQTSDKVVYEAHWYAFSEGRAQEWERNSPTWACQGMVQRFDHRIGYLMNWVAGRDGSDISAPLFISEFGYDQRGEEFDVSGNRFSSCFLAFAAERDVDWCIWALQGSYYWRDGVAGFEETYGVLDRTWDHLKNPKFIERYRLVQDMIQDPSSKGEPYQVIFHPQSGRCLYVDQDSNVVLADCKNRSRWSHGGDGTQITLASTALCLKVAGAGLPVTVSEQCDGGQSLWKAASGSGLQVSGADGEGKQLCLDWPGDSNSSAVLSRECLCLEGSSCPVNPQSQWFKIVSSNIA